MTKTYKYLIVWQRAIQLVSAIYNATRQLPKEELYVLCVQMRRSALSVPSNIAEGYNRHGKAEYIRFLKIANASSYELETQLIVTSEVYPKLDFLAASKLLVEVQKMLSSLIKKLIT